MPAIRIDLGTTNSCVAVWWKGSFEVIANEEGKRTMPSCVAFTNTEMLVEKSAKNQVIVNPRNTVFNVKRLIGRRFDNPSVQEDLKYLPFQVIDRNNKPKIRVEYLGSERDFYPEQISAMILEKLKNVAEAYLGSAVTDAVITVPTYFNNAQRQSTKDAASIAGLNVLQIICAPVAVALAYGFDKYPVPERKVLVFDLGGGTFDVSILKISEVALFELCSTSRNTHLGGEDFNNRLFDHFKSKFESRYVVDISNNQRVLRRLWKAVESAKRDLSILPEVEVFLDALYFSSNFRTKISRCRFEGLCRDLFELTLDCVKDAMEQAKMQKADIDEVI